MHTSLTIKEPTIKHYNANSARHFYVALRIKVEKTFSRLMNQTVLL